MAPTAEAQEVRLMGEWYDQDKVDDPVIRKRWYYEYDPNDPTEPGDLNPRWKYGLGYSKTLVADGNNNMLEDGAEVWGNWAISGDASCWAATASNMVRYMGGGNRYHDWVFNGDWPDGSTYTWQTHGGTSKALHAEGYPTLGEFSDKPTGVWSIDPIAFVKDALADGLPVSLAISDKGHGIGDRHHLVTAWGIDDVNNTITISDSDNGPDFWTDTFTYTGGVWDVPHIPGTAGYGFWINGVRTMSVVRSSTTGSWVTDSVWDFNEVGGHGGNPLNPKFIRLIEMGESGGEVVVPAIGGPYQSARTILKGPDSSLRVISGAELQLGSLFIDRNESMRTGKLTLEGTLTAQRADVKGAFIDVDGGRLDIAPPAGGATIRADLNVGGMTTLYIGNGGEVTVANDVFVVETDHYQGRLYASSGLHDTSGLLDIGGNLRVHNGGIATFTGTNLDANIGGNLVLQGGYIDVLRADLTVDHDVYAGELGSAEIDLNGGSLSCGHFRIGYVPGSSNTLTLRSRSGRDPSLTANQLAFGFEGGETTVEQHVGYVGQRAGAFYYPDMSLAQGAGSLVNYELHDGELEVDDLVYGPGGTGRFKQFGGTATIHGQMILGGVGGAWNNLYRLEGGTLNLHSSIHVSGPSRFEYAGGTLNLYGNSYGFQDVEIADAAGVDLTMEVTDATFDAQQLLVGTYGKGAFEQTRGVTTAYQVAIAQYDGSDYSHITLRGGVLEVDRQIFVGLAGRGTLYQYDGATIRALSLVVGSDDASSQGSSVYHYSGTTDIEDSVILGDFANGTGRYLLDGDASVTLEANFVHVGRMGEGDFEQLGGTHTVATTLTIATEADSRGDYWHNGGDLNTQETRVAAAGVGEYDHRSGTHATNHLVLGAEVGGEGTYSMANSPSGAPAPELNASQVTLGGADGTTGTFTMAAGQAHVTDNVFVGGATGATGSLSVDRPGVEFHVDGDVFVGGAGEGTLTARASGVFSVDGTMTVGGGEIGEVVMEGGRIEGAGTMNITPGTGTLSGRGWIYLPVGNEGLISAGGSGMRFWEPVTGGGRLDITGSASVELMQGGVLNGPVSCPTGNIRVKGGVLEINGGLTGSGTVVVQGELDLGSNVTAGNVSVGQWGSSPAVISHPGPHSVTTSEMYIGVVGRYNLQTGATLGGGDGFVGGLFDHQGGDATFGELMVGGGDEYYWEPGHIAEYRMASGELEIVDLILGVPGPYNMMNPMPGRFTVLSPEADVTVSGGVTLGPVGELDLAPGVTIHMTGSSWQNTCEDPAALADLLNLELIFEGGAGVIDPFEVAGVDLGITMDGYVDNFALGTLRLSGTDIGGLQLVNDSINCGGLAEALYVEHLILGDGSHLDLNGHTLYYFTADIDHGANIVLNGGRLQHVPEPASLVLLILGTLALLCCARPGCPVAAATAKTPARRTAPTTRPAASTSATARRAKKARSSCKP